MNVFYDVDKLVNQCFVEQGGHLEDLSIYLYALSTAPIPGQTIVSGVNERSINLDLMWTVSGVSPEMFAFHLDDFL